MAGSLITAASASNRRSMCEISRLKQRRSFQTIGKAHYQGHFCDKTTF
ncbi:hypothetical protein [Collinsella stercoris]